jgi:chorismate dehydratase
LKPEKDSEFCEAIHLLTNKTEVQVDEIVKISIVSYTNSLPFVYGLEANQNRFLHSLEKDIPSVCAQKLIDEKVDIGLIPVASIPKIKVAHIVSDYCIGADGKVASVLLLSCVPINEIENIGLDFQSRTSAQLIQILAKKFWKINPNWIPADENYLNKFQGTTAALVIGDRTFSIKNNFPFAIDLAEEWKNYTGLPFVFACWVANKKISDAVLQKFSAALDFGISNKNKVIENLKSRNINGLDPEKYLTKNIQFLLNGEMKKGLDLFFKHLKEQ